MISCYFFCFVLVTNKVISNINVYKYDTKVWLEESELTEAPHRTEIIREHT